MRFLLRIMIIVISIFVIAATIATIVVGIKSFDGVVVEKPYEAGLAWDETLQNKAALGWSVNIGKNHFRTGQNELIIVALDRKGRQLENAEIRITTSRPSTRDYDRTYVAVKRPDCRFQTSIDLPLFGSWDVAVTVRRGKDQCSFNNRIFAEQLR
jgi:nitrogen fixation protein FixH